jgi:hypothetical protein
MGPIAARLVAQISEQLRVLRERDGVDLSEAQIYERTRNIVMVLMSLYEIEAVPDRERLGPVALSLAARH